MKTLYATVRIENSTGKAAIFYRNEVKHGHAYVLSCYTREEQHSDASLLYYRTNTRPAKSDAEKAACERLVSHYTGVCAQYGGEKLAIRSRLQSN